MALFKNPKYLNITNFKIDPRTNKFICAIVRKGWLRFYTRFASGSRYI